MSTRRVYLAGPPYAEEYRRRASELTREAGWEPIDPMRRDFRGRTQGKEAEIVEGDLADIDGWVLFEQTCLLGPSPQDHIPCRLWEASVVLFERNKQLWHRVHAPGAQPHPVIANQTIGGDDWRMRVEELS